MTGLLANLVVNVLIIVLLVVTIGYCWILNRRIAVLQDSKGELAQLLKHFDESTVRASESIIALQTASKKIGENIQLRIEKANFLLDDLAFLTEKGGKVADQLEAGFAVQRARSKVEVPVAEEPEINEEQIEEDDIQPVVAAPLQQETPVMPSRSAKTAASLESVLERIVSRTGVKPANTETPAKTEARSRSEQELLAMLKSGMKG